ncbi:sulfatase [Rubritalea marina]|uniref:sulfatase n=1 Tax=Rubritalea marina TaxID=361055 RepID=UPI000375CC8D|nr:sulfatase [Rubritalea marina]
MKFFSASSAFARKFSKHCLGATLSLWGGLEAKPKVQANIVFILADDLGQHQLGCYGSDYYETPHIDQLARDGMRFTNAYAAAAICSPTRASIMTGKYPARLHLTNFIPGGRARATKLVTPAWQKQLPLEEVTVAEALKSAGYATGHFGKWHLNYDKKYEAGRPGDPGSQGFDEVLTTHKPGAGPESRYPEDWHHVREITERATNFIERHKDEAFFCFVSHNSIHDPEIEKKALVEKYQSKAGTLEDKRNNPTQAAMLETLDQSVGKILETLERLNLTQNTLVIFYSDNGQKGVKQGKPLRGSKADFHEAGIRMPFIAKWPSVIPAGSESPELVISNDFFPTFTDIAGKSAARENLDGMSILPILKDPKQSLGRNALYWHFPHYHGLSLGPQGAIRVGKYKLIEWYEKSAFNRPGAFELYDLSKDPGETNNLSKSMPELTARLKKQLDDWKTNVGAQPMRKRQAP